MKTQVQMINNYKALEKKALDAVIKIKDAEKKAQDKIAKLKAGLMKDFNFEVGEEVILHLLEYRDDRVGCFQAEQKVTCYITGIVIMDPYDGTDNFFLAPVTHMKGSNKKLKAKPMHYNEYCSWKLYRKDGVKPVLFSTPESIIIEGKYTEASLATTRARCTELQKF